MEIKTQGFDEFNALLKKLPVNVEKRVMQNAVMSAARVGRKAIKAAAPKGEKISSVQKKRGYGSLRKEMRVFKLRRVGRNERAARVGTGRAFWAFFYERGTSKQPARPFFAKAFKSAESAMIAKLSERLKIGIEREWNKLK